MGRTALHLSVLARDVPLTKQLISEAIVDVHEKDAGGRNVMHHLAEYIRVYT